MAEVALPSARVAEGMPMRSTLHAGVVLHHRTLLSTAGWWGLQNLLGFCVKYSASAGRKSSVEWPVIFRLRAGYSWCKRAVAVGRDHDVFDDPDGAIVRHRRGDLELRGRRPGVR